MSDVAHLLRLIAVLFVVLMAPKGMMARVRGLDVIGLVNLLQSLEWLRGRGRLLRYPGESLATVAARIDLVVWIARTPAKARAHLSRQLRGWKRARLGGNVPPSFTPPRLAVAALRGARAPVVFADSS